MKKNRRRILVWKGMKRPKLRFLDTWIYAPQFSLALIVKLQFTTQKEKSIRLYVRAPTNYVNASFTTRCGTMGLMITTDVLTNDDVNLSFSIGVTTTSYSTMTGPIMFKEITRSTLELIVGRVYVVDGIEITTKLIIQRNNKIYTKISTHRYSYVWDISVGRSISNKNVHGQRLSDSPTMP
jgi:hypothetical protein